MLGFHDTISTDELAKGDLLTYLVVGWYSDPEMDPLRQQNGDDLLASLRWSCASLDGATVPQRTLCHGTVVNLQWRGTDEEYPSASSGSTPPTIAIGGSGAEALAAMLASDDPSLQQALCAFQHGQATQVTELDQLGDLLHRHGFGAVPGGKLWAIEADAASSTTPDVMSAGENSSPKPVSAKVQSLLGKLNEAQRAFDRQARKVESLRWRLFACWVTWASEQTGPPGERPGRKVVDSAMAACREARDELPKYEGSVERSKQEVTASLIAEETGMQLAESTMPPFLFPKDPFVLLKGDNLVGIDRTAEQRSEQDADDSLQCRLAEDIVTGLSESRRTSKQWSAENCFTLNFPDAAAVPPGPVARTLALEALLFDPNCATLVEANDDSFDLDLFTAMQESLERSREQNGNTLTWNGQPPAPLGVTRRCKNNPWLPTYLMWQTLWVPAKEHGLGSQGGEPARVNFDSKDPLAGDLVWSNDEAMQPSGEGVTLEGATIIAPLSGNQLAANLRDYTTTDGEENDILESIDQTQALGQSLGGFNDLLLRRTLGLCLPPVDPISKQLDSRIWEAIGEIPQPVMPVDGAFLPVRAGALKLLHLCIVDSFGQTRELVNDSGAASAPQPRVIASAALSPPAAGYDAGFSRKLVPPARLNFDWQPAAEEAPGPICGWIVPNFLDKSFAVFSARGMPLGVLESVLPTLAKKSIGSEMRFKWLPIPGSALAIEEIENLRLQRFVKLVTSFTADEGQAFLELADLVLRRTVGRVPAEDPAMAVLLGRPLALVHASLGLEVPEPPGYWKTNGEWNFESEDFEKLRVPVLLGGMKLPSDGLVGYMADDDESAFFASEGATRRLRSKKKVKYRQGLSVACADELPVSLTLLMDTSAPVHASTGILPRHRVSLPAEAAQLASLIEEFYVGVAPVLGARPRETAAEPVMPQPSDAFGQWSWATRPDLRNTPPTWHDIRPADDLRAYGRRPG